MKNRLRILSLLEILRRYSDEEHSLSTEAITALLENEFGLEDIYRKTINQDLRDLAEAYPQYQLNYRHKAGYSLSESPFSLAEVKILLDSLDSLQTLDPAFLEKLKEKLCSFLSVYETKVLETLRADSEHGSGYFIYHFETLLNSYKHSHSVLLLRKGRDEEEEILPLFFERVRNQYYLLYRYPEKKKIYRLRFDNIEQLTETDREVDLSVPHREIQKYLEEASDAYHGEETASMTLQLRDSDPRLRRWLKEDFPTIRFYEDKAVLTAGLNDRFFAKLSAYGDRIKLSSPSEAQKAYLESLNKILASYNEP
ncbi:MAG: WYL domain-containing protein [Erysipelotrichaceae bacterium]|nr:WYL domain-containing protein [Erysipelotrichaceae bacterium]